MPAFILAACLFNFMQLPALFFNTAHKKKRHQPLTGYCYALHFNRDEDLNADTHGRQEKGNKRRALLNKAEIQTKPKKQGNQKKQK